MIVVAAVNFEIGTASADIVASFTTDGTSTTFVANPGESVLIPVYLVQSGVGETRLSVDGLFGAGIRGTIANPGANMSFFVNGLIAPQFSTLAGSDVSATTVGFGGVVDLGSFNNLPKGNFIKIGDFQLTAGSAGTTTIISLSDRRPGIEDIVTGTFEVLDGIVNFSQTTTLQVVSVPEPSSLFLLTTICAWIGTVVHRRRKVFFPDARCGKS